MPAINYQKTATSDKAWDGGQNEKNLKTGEDKAYYSKMYAWIDSNADATTKGAYKFPHHEVSGGGDIGDANIRACQAVIAVLNGSMGGTSISTGDKQGVYNHVSKHLRDADIEPAELKRSNSHQGHEIRIAENEIEIRENTDKGTVMIRGYAVKWRSLSTDLGGFREQFDQGAFQNSLRKDSAYMFWAHDDTKILASTRNKTLDLYEDDLGLRFEATLPDTQDGRDAKTLIQNKYINGMSFGFRASIDEWDESNPQMLTRTVKEARLFEISPVPFPAYPQSYVSSRQESSCKEVIDEYKNKSNNMIKRAEMLRNNIIKNKEVE